MIVYQKFTLGPSGDIAKVLIIQKEYLKAKYIDVVIRVMDLENQYLAYVVENEIVDDSFCE